MRIIAILLASLFFAGCTDEGFDPTQGNSSAVLTIDVVAGFTAEQLTFELQANKNIPTDIRVVMRSGDVSEQINAGAMDGIGTTKARFTPPMAMETETPYTIEVAVNGAVVASRTFTFYEGALDEPAEDVHAEYDATLTMDDGEMEMELSADVTMDVVGGEFTMRMEGSGVAYMEEEGMNMELRIDPFDFTATEDRTTAGYMRGEGTWTMEDDESTGSGGATMEMTFLGFEYHENGAGNMIEGEKNRFFMTMDGEMLYNGQTMHMNMESEEISWSDPESGESFWRQGYEEMNILFGGQNYPEYEEFDEAVTGEDAENGLSDRLPEEGPSIWPLAVGDQFVHTGDGINVEYTVKRGANTFVGGLQASTFVIEGKAIWGAQGTEEIVLVADGPYAQLPTSISYSYSAGGEREEMEATLVRVS